LHNEISSDIFLLKIGGFSVTEKVVGQCLAKLWPELSGLFFSGSRCVENRALCRQNRCPDITVRVEEHWKCIRTHSPISL